jgi:hypothetical protein
VELAVAAEVLPAGSCAASFLVSFGALVAESPPLMWQTSFCEMHEFPQGFPLVQFLASADKAKRLEEVTKQIRANVDAIDFI